MLRHTILSILLLTSFSATSNSAPNAPTNESPTTAFRQPDAPTFNITVADFRSRHNQNFPQLHLNAYRAVSTPDDQPFTVVATGISSAVHSSAAVEKGTEKIKSLQIIYWPAHDPEINDQFEELDSLLGLESANSEVDNAQEKDKKDAANGTETANRQLAIRYMAAIIQGFSPTLSTQESLEKVVQLLNNGKNNNYSQQDGSLRYVVSDSGEAGLMFAIEPINSTPSESANF